MTFIKWGFILLFFFVNAIASHCQQQTVGMGKVDEDSLRKARAILNESKVSSKQREIKIVIRNVDITEFPTIKVIVEAFNIYGAPLDTLLSEDLKVRENGVSKTVTSIEKISVKERVPVDFVFIIDQTGTMQSSIDLIMRNIKGFTKSLVEHGIDFKIGLVLFSDEVEGVYNPTGSIDQFLSWLGRVRASGGGDTPENALEAINDATQLEFRPSADKVFVLITDARYHQKGDADADGVSEFTTETITNKMLSKDVRLFTITPLDLKEYQRLSKATRGTSFDMKFPFSVISTNFSNQLTNLYALKYQSDQATIPDSINIALLNKQKQELVRRTIPIIELGRKLIIEKLLYKSGRSDIPEKVKELEVLTDFMLNRPNVVIMVEGHTDSDGSFKLNDRLSLQRAKGVRKYLVNKGIASSRVKTKGYGERKPIASNETVFGKKLNRRTEIVIISK